LTNPRPVSSAKARLKRWCCNSLARLGNCSEAVAPRALSQALSHVIVRGSRGCSKPKVLATLRALPSEDMGIMGFLSGHLVHTTGLLRPVRCVCPQVFDLAGTTRHSDELRANAAPCVPGFENQGQELAIRTPGLAAVVELLCC
jgi:hypothetical protein